MGGIFEVIHGKGKIDVLLLVIVVREGRRYLVLLAGLRLAAIAFLTEGEVEIVAVETHPVALPRLRRCLRLLEAGLGVLDWCEVVHLTFEFIFRVINGAIVRYGPSEMKA
jgi:hypothetical protein